VFGSGRRRSRGRDAGEGPRASRRYVDQLADAEAERQFGLPPHEQAPLPPFEHVLAAQAAGTVGSVPAVESATSSGRPDPGWYSDPTGEAQLRWWSGSAWTAITHGPLPPG
jgi:hypothetical protein